MRSVHATALSFVLLASIAGCGGGSSHTDAAVIEDMSVSSAADLSMDTGLSCSAYLDCIHNCDTTSKTQAAYDDCRSNTCTANAKSTTVNKQQTGLFDVARGCHQLYCVGANFDMPYKCGVDFTKGFLTEVDGQPLAAGGVCATCLLNADALLFGTACSDPASPDCSATSNSAAAAQCGTPVKACYDDK